MKALSLRQPWAWLVVNGIKDLENRSWRTNLRGKFLIHASMALEKPAYHFYKSQIPQMPHEDELEHGGIVGEVELVDIIDKNDPRANSIWFQGPFAFVLKNAKTLPFRKVRGKLSFFDV